jgi:predicted DNA-binding WGR domain protein
MMTPDPMLRTHLTKHDPVRNLHRYYALEIAPNLFGGFSLICTWGRIGQSGQSKIDLCASEAEAHARYRQKLHEKQRRGYA